jgi:hypothetical protein
VKRAAVVLAAIGAVLAARRWRPRTMHLSPDTLADIARREDRSGSGVMNQKDAHPFAVERIRVLPQNRPGVDPRFARGR